MRSTAAVVADSTLPHEACQPGPNSPPNSQILNIFQGLTESRSDGRPAISVAARLVCKVCRHRQAPGGPCSTATDASRVRVSTWHRWPMAQSLSTTWLLWADPPGPGDHRQLAGLDVEVEVEVEVLDVVPARTSDSNDTGRHGGPRDSKCRGSRNALPVARPCGIAAAPPVFGRGPMRAPAAAPGVSRGCSVSLP